MANVLRLSKFSTTKHKHQILPRLPPSLNINIIRFAPNLDLSRSSLKITNQITPKSSSSVPFAIQPPMIIDGAADPCPIWENAILKPLRKCAIPLLIMAVLFIAYPDSAWGRAPNILLFKSVSQRIRSGEIVAHEGNKAEGVAIVIVFVLLALSMTLYAYRRCSWANPDWDVASVVMLQVGLSGKAKSLQIPASSIRTIHGRLRVLKGTIHALWSHPDYCISAYSCVDVKFGIDNGIRKLRQLFKEERAKFSEEQRHHPFSLSAGVHNDDYIVVTIGVAVQGFCIMPAIKTSMDLKHALESLNSTLPSEIKGVEVLWTPQAENRTLSERDLESYPLLKPLYE